MEGGQSGGLEGLQEVSQSIVNRAQAGQDLFSEDALKEYEEALRNQRNMKDYKEIQRNVKKYEGIQRNTKKHQELNEYNGIRRNTTENEGIGRDTKKHRKQEKLRITK